MVEKAAPEPVFEALLRYIQESRGIDFRGYKRTSLRRRILLRMETVGVEDFASYQSYLEVHPDEFADLLNTVLINVTSFFRDSEAWDILRSEVVPAILARTAHEPAIRVWSVGCASGEEPYSLAMLFAEHMGLEAFCERVKIYATDLDEEALKAARLANYSSRDVESVPQGLRDKYFERTGNRFVFHRELRKSVIFGRHNVVRDAPISRVDLLVCRNLLIYLEAETQDGVLPRLHYALSSEGFLFLGKAETQLARSALFRPVEMKHRIFMKVTQEWRRTTGGGFTVSRNFRSREADSDQERLLEAVLNEAQAAYLVVDGDGQLVLANVAARQMLSVGEGDIGRPFQDLPISYRPIELRAPIEQVMRDRRSVRIENQELQAPNGEMQRMTVELRALFRPDGSAFSVLLAFTDTTRQFLLQRELAAAQGSLENSIEELQSANEELETTNEELQSTNEELETTNEELQSTNEELETINEEARSTAEEMESVNEELQIQAEQSNVLRLHLESVLRGLNIGVIVVDRRMQVESWNRWNERTWGLKADDAVGVGLEALDIGFPMHLLRDSVLAVQSGQSEFMTQILEGVDRRGRALKCRIKIFSPLSREERSEGAVLAFEDVTAEERKDEFARHLGRVMGRAVNEIYFIDARDFTFRLANAGAERRLGYGAQLLNMTAPDVMPDITAERFTTLLRPLIAGEVQELAFETTIRPAEEPTYQAEVRVQYFSDESPPILLTVVHDIATRPEPVVTT